MSVLLSEEEIQAFYELDEFCFKLYVTVLRKYMDYSNGIVGSTKRRISYRSMQEAMYVKPKRGIPALQTGTPHESRIRRSLDNLKSKGIIEQIKSNIYLIFKLPLALRDESVRKIPDRNSIPLTDAIDDTLKTYCNEGLTGGLSKVKRKADANLDTPKTSIPDTPPYSGKDKEKELLRSSKKKVERRMQIPDDFKVTEHHCELAMKNKWADPSTEIEQFRHYHKGKGSLMLNWDSAFYTWLGNAKRFKERTNGNYQSNTKQPNSVTKVVDSILRRYEKPQS